MKEIKGYKGFDKDMKCRGFQYEEGKEYKHEGEVKTCNSGFHFCENPLDVFSYYTPSESKYSEVTGSGDISKSEDKVSCSEIKIGASLSLHQLIEASVKFTLEKCKFYKKSNETKDKSIAKNTGYQSASTNTGYQSASTNTGNRSASTNTGDYSASTNTGKQGCAISLGIEGKAQGVKGCWLTIAEWKEIDNEWNRIDVKTVIVDGKKIKENTFYQLKEGKFVEYKD
mgnify:CR=1 FL=1